MNAWDAVFKQDPIQPLLQSGNQAVLCIYRRDLLEESLDTAVITALPGIQRIIKKQNADGSFSGSGSNMAVYPPHHDALVETFKTFRLLVKRYGLNREFEPVRRAAEYLISWQTQQGDFRGFIGNQYATYYTGAVAALLLRAGYAWDPRLEQCLHWLLSMRQTDGGWSIPILTHRLSREQLQHLTSSDAAPVEPHRSKPFSHTWTNMILEALACHPRYRESAESQKAALLLKGSFFKPDYYTSYQHPRYWVRFVHWWPNLLTAMDSLISLGFGCEDLDIQKGWQWFIHNQCADGLWNLENDGKTILHSPRIQEERLWLALDICRLAKRIK